MVITSVNSDNYLCAIYRGDREEQRPVTGVELSVVFGVSAATVSAKLKRLEERGLVRRGRRTTLTQQGVARAEQLIRRQRLAEVLLTQMLQMPWPLVPVEASELKHSITDVLEEHLILALGRPERSPYGYPIPGLCDPPPPGTSLASLERGAQFAVERVFDRDALLLRFCDENGIVPGAQLAVGAKEDGSGTLIVKGPWGETAVGVQVAERIWVVPSNRH